MSILEGFRDQSFIEQFSSLTEIECAADPTTIAPLQDLFLNPVGDAAVDTMVRKVLRSLLLQNDAVLLQCVADDDKRLALYCVGLAGEAELRQAVPLLLVRAEDWADDADSLHQVLFALARIGDAAALELFREHLTHEDDYVAALCIEQLGALQDTASLPDLEALVEANESPERYAQCDVTTWKAIEAMAAIGSDGALGFLASKLHHENPTARRIIAHCLVDLGERPVPFVADALRRARSTDDKILAANVLGFTGGKQAADALVNALDDGVLREPNELFAAYEALGRIPVVKSLVVLKDVLWNEQSAFLLMAVAKGLDNHCLAGMGKALARDAVEQFKDNDVSERVLDAVIGAQATAFFCALHAESELREQVSHAAMASADPETLEIFAQALEQAGEPSAAKALKRACEGRETSADAPRLFAVDDSEAMRTFYAQVGAELGYRVKSAQHGQEALDMLEQEGRCDIMIVDMNMPVMDGIELTTRLRAMPDWRHLPVLMATTESAKSQAQLAKQAGVNGFIVKPFTKEVLKNKLMKVRGACA